MYRYVRIPFFSLRELDFKYSEPGETVTQPMITRLREATPINFVHSLNPEQVVERVASGNRAVAWPTDIDPGSGGANKGPL